MIYELGVVAGDDLKSPTIALDGRAFPFVVVRSNLSRASTTGNAVLEMGWKDGDGRDYYTGKKRSHRGRNQTPDQIVERSVSGGHNNYRTDVIDMGFLAAGLLDEQLESQNRAWIDATVTEISIRLWAGGADAPNGAKFDLDYIKICDGLARMPEPVLTAVLETARHISEGGGSGVQAKSIGDFSQTMGPGEASAAIPPSARMMLEPYRRPSW